ncbi:helix-turn-helix domain-containing protein [Streptomyces buecherae]|uniref:helix-turn-helix domain-containing protein n=1 Tax=Streptomyces buecherae TaxID=2763006 RepID=UPI0036794837
MGTRNFVRRAQQMLRDRGLSIRAASRAMSYDPAYLTRVLAGRQAPSGALAVALDRLLGAEGELLSLLAAAPRTDEPAAAPLVRISDVRGAELARAIRETSQRLVVLDNEDGGMPIADTAAYAFRTVHARLRCGDYEQPYDRDIRSAAAELAEIAGWALFDAEKHDAAERYNDAALDLARASGDRTMELLILQNIAMVAEWRGQYRKALDTASGVLVGRLSSRVRAMFLVRDAKGRFGTGDAAGGARALDQARVLLDDGARDDDPAWAWWVSHQEIDGHLGYALWATGRQREAVPHLRGALESAGSARVGYRSISTARLLDCLIHEGAWREAEELAVGLHDTAGKTASARTRNLLSASVRRGLPTAPPSAGHALEHLGHIVNSDPLSLD